jgi:hypothetical protein
VVSQSHAGVRKTGLPLDNFTIGKNSSLPGPSRVHNFS